MLDLGVIFLIAVTLIKETLNRIVDKNREVLNSVPRHESISSHDKVDRLAEEGAAERPFL